MLAFAAVMYSAAAFAQSSAPPAAVALKPATEAKSAKPAKTSNASKTKKIVARGSIAGRLEACQDIDDGTKGRLDCYDEVIKPAPKTTIWDRART